jgi:hypothetical protein
VGAEGCCVISSILSIMGACARTSMGWHRK